MVMMLIPSYLGMGFAFFLPCMYLCMTRRYSVHVHPWPLRMCLYKYVPMLPFPVRCARVDRELISHILVT